VTPDSESMPKIAHTTRLRSGMYKLNMKVPKALHEAGFFGGKEKIVESLETKEHGEALLKAPIRAGEIKTQFAELLQQLKETGSIEPAVLDTPPRHRRKALTKGKVSKSGQCCFMNAGEGAMVLAEQFAREYFIDLLKASEADVEGYYTRKDVEGLDAILSDTHQRDQYWSLRFLQLH